MIAGFQKLDVIILRSYVMKNFFILTDAVNYIEDHICEDISCQMVADFCFVSLSSLQKLFRYALHKSLKDYITRRRICCAADDILKTELSFTDITYKYCFHSPEVFSRTFHKVWNESPSSFKKHWKFSGIYPKLDYNYEEGEDLEMARKKVDISEAYEVFKELKGTYVLCFDIFGLVPINNISFAAGDLAIIETARRIDEVRGDNTLMFRIGGDEFALVTGSKEEEEVHEIARKVQSKNGQTFRYENQDIPLSLWLGLTKIPETNLRYSDFFMNMHQAIHHSKD